MRATIIAAAFLCSSAAHAAVLSQTQPWSVFGEDGYDQSQPTFDPTLGKLDGVRVTVSGQFSWQEDVLLTQPAGHVTVLRDSNTFDAEWTDDLGNPLGGIEFAVPQGNFIDTKTAAYPSDSMKIYGTSVQNPADFAGGAQVTLLIDGLGGADLSYCTPPCHAAILGDEITFGYGSVTTTFTYTPFAVPVPEPASALLLLPALGLILWRKRVGGGRGGWAGH